MLTTPAAASRFTGCVVSKQGDRRSAERIPAGRPLAGLELINMLRPFRRLRALDRLRRRRLASTNAARLVRLIENRLNVQLGDVSTEDLRRACRAVLGPSVGRPGKSGLDDTLRAVIEAVDVLRRVQALRRTIPQVHGSPKTKKRG